MVDSKLISRFVSVRNLDPQPAVPRDKKNIPIQDGDPPDHPPTPDPFQPQEQYNLRHDPINRNRIREDDRQKPPDVKLTTPTFAGKFHPEAYLECERMMEYIFNYYSYT